MDMNGHISHGKSLGLEFSKEDFKALAKEAGLDGENELSEEELKKVAGGYATTTTMIVVVSLVAGTPSSDSPPLSPRPNGDGRNL
jgi:hypothetical protein